MKKLSLWALKSIGAAVLALSLVPLAQAQGPGPGREIMVVGNNPAMTQRDQANGKVMSEVNFWRISWSPVGAGHVCFITIHEGKHKGVRIAIYDNEELLDYVTNDLMSTLLPTFNQPAYEPHKGTVTQSGDGKSSVTETCKSEKYNVELTWGGLQQPVWAEWTPSPESIVEMTFAMVQASSTSIVVNGEKAPGAYFQSGMFPAAYLALNETWLKKLK